MHPLKKWIMAFAVLAGTPGWGAVSQFPEHNFSIEIPKGWVNMSPRPPQALVASQNADNTQRLLVFAIKLPANERTTGASDMRAGAKKSISEQGARIDPE